MAIFLIRYVAPNGDDFEAEVLETSEDDLHIEVGQVVPMRSLPGNMGWPEVGETFEAQCDGRPN